MDPSSYQQMMVQALMGGAAQPGLAPSATAQNPTTGYGQSFIAGNPTVPGGMLGSSPYQTINPMSPQQGQAGQMSGYDPTQLQQPYQQYPGVNNPTLYPTPDHADGGAQ